MNRTLLALALAFAATGALAVEPEPAEAAPSDCPQSEQADEKAAPAQAGSATTRVGTPAPVRPRTNVGTRGAPRWHSMFPGMIR